MTYNALKPLVCFLFNYQLTKVNSGHMCRTDLDCACSPNINVSRLRSYHDIKNVRFHWIVKMTETLGHMTGFFNHWPLRPNNQPSLLGIFPLLAINHPEPDEKTVFLAVGQWGGGDYMEHIRNIAMLLTN